MQIRTYEQLVNCLVLQNANLATYKTQVGATGADLTAVSEELGILQYIDEYAATTDAKKKTVFEIKQAVFNGDPDDGVSPFPVFAAAAPPAALVAGCLERAQKRNARFKTADGYTKEIGIALGIDGDSSSISPDSVKPTLEVTPAQSGYEAAIVVGKRGNATMYKVLGRRMNSETWNVIDSGTGKGGSITITATTPGLPEKMQLKIQLYKNNEPYGQQSDPVDATFNP